MQDAMDLARQAMAGGRWEEARAQFASLLELGEDVDVLRGLGDALWWLGDGTGCLRCLERVYSLDRESGDLIDAVTDCLWLAALQLKTFGNRSACSGWIATAERLIEAGDLDMLRGWVLWAQATVAEPEAAQEYAQRSVAAARELGDRDLELCALSELGRAYVALGRQEEGMRLIDEAMAAAMGEKARNLETVVSTCCSMMGACDLAADLERVAEWCRAADDFMKTYGSPFLYADCRLRYGSVLLATGHWDQAERELRNAAEATGRDTDYFAESRARLAILRLRQGRLEEAEAFLSEIQDQPAAGIPLAELHHRRGDHAVAARLLSRAEGSLANPIDEARRLELLADCQLTLSNVEAARSVVERLAELSKGASERVEAHYRFAEGRLARAEGNQSAERLLERSMRLFSSCNLPYETARVRLLLARALAGSPDLAVGEGQGAFATFDRLGATADADEAAQFVRSLGGGARTGPKDFGVLTKREEEVLRLVAAGLTNPEIAERLFLSRKTVAHHVSNILAKLGLRNRAEAAILASGMLASDRASA